jgi:hypothetical protein
MRWLPRHWNDILAVVMIFGLPIYWWVAAPNEMITGATIAGWTLCAQYYYRKAPEGGQ